MLSAAELYQRAVVHSNAGRHAVAIRTLAAASARSTGIDLSARIAGTLAYLEAETGDVDAALSRCAAALAEQDLAASTRAILTGQLGLIELRRGDFAVALPHLDAAIAGLADDPARVGRILLNRGLAHLESGDIHRSELDFGAAVTAFDSMGDAVEGAKALHNQGYAALLRGDLVSALHAMDAARVVLAEQSPVFLAVCDLDRAEVLRAAGMTSDAVILIASAARSFGLRRLRQMQADAEFTLAGTLLDSDPSAAAAAARTAARRYRGRGNETAALRADATALIARILGGAGGPNLRHGVERAGQALANRDLRPDAARLALHGARLDLRAGDPPAAQRILSRLRADAAAWPITTRLLAHEIATEIAEKRAATTEILAEARAGLDELADWQSSFGNIDLLSSTSARGRRLALAGIRAAISTEDPETVFEWSELARSIASRMVPVRPPADPETSALLSELRRLRLGDPDPAREADLIAAIRHRGWLTASARDVSGLTTLDDARRDIRDSDAELVCYLWTGTTLVALVVGEATTLVDLGAWEPIDRLLAGLLADLDMVAADLPTALAAPVRTALNARLEQLDALLVRPFRERLSARRLIVSAPGVLAGVPWGMLPSLAGRALTLPPSVGAWRERGPAPKHPSRTAFVAGPDVARAEDEVLSAAAHWTHSRTLLGPKSTVEAATALARDADLLHVSAHGRHSAENPLFSGLELVDGPWFGFDVDRLDRVPALVILSACEAGRSAVGWGRESLGMAQAWLHAGARCVVAAPASVNDAHAGEMLAAVHERLAAGEATSDAVVAATSALGRVSAFQVYGRGW